MKPSPILNELRSQPSVVRREEPSCPHLMKGWMCVIVFFILPSLWERSGMGLHAQLLDTAALMAQPVYDDLNQALQRPNNIYRLSLRGKKLKSFPMEILKLKNLQELDISRNKLDSLPEQIGVLINLQVLNVSGNKLQYLPDSIGELKNLKKLVGSRNNLMEIPKRIGDLKNLEVLDLWQNDLSVFPGEMKKLTKLQWMDLRVILINDETQQRLHEMLPKTVIHFSPSCHCVTG
ncbi:MAG: leucine-rich repeat domain-containing protein [Bacteroidetes bacterium]|nr:leucine-rich repeat domain-containing protein [Bacteroidota bacterium]